MPKKKNELFNVWLIQSALVWLSNGFNRRTALSAVTYLFFRSTLDVDRDAGRISNNINKCIIFFYTFDMVVSGVLEVIGNIQKSHIYLFLLKCGNLFQDITCDSHPASNAWLFKSNSNCPTAKTVRMAYIRSINWLSVPPPFQLQHICPSLPRGPVGSHTATVSHVLSAHLEVIEVDILHVLDSSLGQWRRIISMSAPAQEK